MSDASVLRRLRPGRDAAVDAAFGAVLAVVAVMGLQRAYGSWAFLAVAAVGALVGLALAHLVTALRVAPATGVLVVAAGFVLGGGMAVPEAAIARVLPGPALPGAFLEGLVRSWSDLVTTAPPVGLDGSLGVVPYVCGFVAAGGGLLVARATVWPLVPAAPGFLALVASIVFGTREPVSVIAQGAGFVLVAVAWGAVRANRPRRSPEGGVYWPRIVSGAAMLVAVSAVALPLGGVLPLASDDRFVLREEHVPPFDPRAEPSPLNAFRHYLVGPAKETELFRVQGLPARSRLRLATMDTYDGVVWVVGGEEATASGRFERVGEEVIPIPDGERASVTVEVLADRSDVWLPTVDWTESVTFEGSHAQDLRDTWRYNRLTGTAATPGRLRAGDRYRLEAVLAPPRDPEASRGLGVDTSLDLPTLPELPDLIGEKATELGGGGTTGYLQVEQLEATLAEGFYLSGDPEEVPEGAPQSAPGHSLRRIVDFIEGPNGLVGNEEQYAATMTLLARQLGLPARVVIGFSPPEDESGAPVVADEYVFTGADVDAWVEVAFPGRGWVVFDPTPPEDRVPEQEPIPQRREQTPPPQEPPPPTYLQLPESLPEMAAPEVEPEPETGGFQIPTALLVGLGVASLPFLLVAGFLALVGGLKARRMKRRRYQGTVAQQASGAWREACDRARDHGVDLPRRATRSETAPALAPALGDGGVTLAERVDAVTFGADEPDPAAVAQIWTQVDEAWAESLAGMGLVQRLRVKANLRSLAPRRSGRS